MRSVTRKVVADHLVISKRRRDRLTVSVRQPFLEQVGPFLLDQLPVCVLEHRLEEQKPHPDRPVFHGAYQMRPRPSPTECGRKTCVAPPAAEIIAFALNT